MRLIYKHQHEGVWFSRNGQRAYLRGEKPAQLWRVPVDQLEATAKHHITRTYANGVPSGQRELVMFYRMIRKESR
jgi:hypothetical protein